MTIGGYDSSHFKNEIQWVNLYGSEYYSVKAEQILIEGRSVGLSKEQFTTSYTTGTIVDSGTTFVYLVHDVYKAFWSAFFAFCNSSPDNCGTKMVRVSAKFKMCFKIDREDLDDFYSTFPRVTVIIEGVKVDWSPNMYMFTKDSNPDDYCVGVFDSGDSGNILGGLFMRGSNVVFDTTNKRIGFALSDCDPSIVSLERRLSAEIVEISRTPMSVEGTGLHEGGRLGFRLVFCISGGIMVLGLIYRRRKSQLLSTS